MHMITVKDHIFHTRDILCTRDDALLTLRFDQANEDSGSDDDDDDGDSDDDDDGQEMNNEVDSDEKQNKEAIIDEVVVVNDGRIDHDCLFSMIFPNMFVALRSRPSSIESFFVLKVKTKDVAKEMITDEGNHTILAGEHIRGYYLNRIFESKTQVKYNIPKKSSEVYIHLEEIFDINLELSSSLVMDIAEYNSLNMHLY